MQSPQAPVPTQTGGKHWLTAWPALLGWRRGTSGLGMVFCFLLKFDALRSQVTMTEFVLTTLFELTF